MSTEGAGSHIPVVEESVEHKVETPAPEEKSAPPAVVGSPVIVPPQLSDGNSVIDVDVMLTDPLILSMRHTD